MWAAAVNSFYENNCTESICSEKLDWIIKKRIGVIKNANKKTVECKTIKNYLLWHSLLAGLVTVMLVNCKRIFALM